MWNLKLMLIMMPTMWSWTLLINCLVWVFIKDQGLCQFKSSLKWTNFEFLNLCCKYWSWLEMEWEVLSMWCINKLRIIKLPYGWVIWKITPYPVHLERTKASDITFWYWIFSPVIKLVFPLTKEIYCYSLDSLYFRQWYDHEQEYPALCGATIGSSNMITTSAINKGKILI